jgi:hypothetical protein
LNYNIVSINHPSADGKAPKNGILAASNCGDLPEMLERAGEDKYICTFMYLFQISQ